MSECDWPSFWMGASLFSGGFQIAANWLWVLCVCMWEFGGGRGGGGVGTLARMSDFWRNSGMTCIVLVVLVACDMRDLDNGHVRHLNGLGTGHWVSSLRRLSFLHGVRWVLKRTFWWALLVTCRYSEKALSRRTDESVKGRTHAWPWRYLAIFYVQRPAHTHTHPK